MGRAPWPAPRLTTSFCFALAETSDDPRAQIHTHLRHYMNWIPAQFVDAMAPTARFAAYGATVAYRFIDAAADVLETLPVRGRAEVAANAQRYRTTTTLTWWRSGTA